MTTETSLFDPVPFASKDLNISARQVAAVAKLFAEGNTVPFIARYRKEAHGNLDEVHVGVHVGVGVGVGVRAGPAI